MLGRDERNDSLLIIAKLIVNTNHWQTNGKNWKCDGITSIFTTMNVHVVFECFMHCSFLQIKCKQEISFLILQRQYYNPSGYCIHYHDKQLLGHNLYEPRLHQSYFWYLNITHPSIVLKLKRSSLVCFSLNSRHASSRSEFE